MTAREACEYTDLVFSELGPGKRNELARLLYEISRRDGGTPQTLLPPDKIASRDFFQIKADLVRRRFPSLTAEERARIPPLTVLDFSEQARVQDFSGMTLLREVFYEKELEGSLFLKRVREKLPDIPFKGISSVRDFRKQRPLTIVDYNRRCETLFIIRERYDFFLHCPCSKMSLPCGYHILNAGMGCGFDCEYCYLQGYVNAPGITIPGNLEEMLGQFSDYYQTGMRLGTGQFTDSLFLDDLTGFSKQIIQYFRGFPDITFEFKTKSRCVSGILSEQAAENIIVSWSVNPRKISDRMEHGSASLADRLHAAHACVQAGYRVGFHFDPIIHYHGWEADYTDVIDQIFSMIPDGRIAWISLGCLRMTFAVRKALEQRFPDSIILNAEQILGYDEKLRYPERVRVEIYRTMLNHIHRFSREVPVYLCMEDNRINQVFALPPVVSFPSC